MTSEKFLKDAGEKFHDNLPERIKILGPIDDASEVKHEQIISRKSKDGYEFRLAVDVEVPGLKGKRNLMVRTDDIKDKYRVHGCKHLIETVNPTTNQVTIPKGAFTFCVV